MKSHAKLYKLNVHEKYQNVVRISKRRFENMDAKSGKICSACKIYRDFLEAVFIACLNQRQTAELTFMSARCQISPQLNGAFPRCLRTPFPECDFA